MNNRMKNGVEEEVYYFLLEWKDRNMTEWLYKASHIYGVERLCDLTPQQLNELYVSIKG